MKVVLRLHINNPPDNQPTKIHIDVYSKFTDGSRVATAIE